MSRLMAMLVAFDFHGVLSMGNEWAVCYYCNLALQYFGTGCRMDISTVVLNYGVSFKSLLKIACPNGEEELYVRMEKFILEHQKESFDRVVSSHIRPQPFARHTLEALRKQGHDCIVVSSTQPQTIRRFTDMVELTDCFVDVVGVFDPSVRTTHMHDLKAEAIRAQMAKRNYDKVVMIGDAASDMIAGKLASATTYLYATPSHDDICDCSEKWSNIIASTSPDHVIRDLRLLI